MNQISQVTVDIMMDTGYKRGILLMIISSCCVCIGQLFWKLSANGIMIFLIPGFLLYGAGFIVMVTAYKYGSVSKLQPVLSLSYIFAVLIGFCVFGEIITFYKSIGIIIITASVILIGISTN